jgi:hypothetical protein
MEVIIRIEDVYGRETYYPANDLARSFARLCGTRTLTLFALEVIKEMGFKIVFQNRVPEVSL